MIERDINGNSADYTSKVWDEIKDIDLSSYDGRKIFVQQLLNEIFVSTKINFDLILSMQESLRMVLKTQEATSRALDSLLGAIERTASQTTNEFNRISGILSNNDIK